MAYNIRLGLTAITLLPRDHYRTYILIASIIVVTDRRSMLLKHIMYIYKGSVNLSSRFWHLPESKA
jgi:hypothetical protein